jgi:hypothetical protein
MLKIIIFINVLIEIDTHTMGGMRGRERETFTPQHCMLDARERTLSLVITQNPPQKRST